MKVSHEKLLRGSEQSHKVYTRWGSNMVENVSATCYDLQSNLSRILGIGKVESAPFFDNNIIRSWIFATETCAQTPRKTPETRRKTRDKNSNHDFCPEITLRGVAKQQRSVGNCKTLHLIEVQNKLLNILKVTISWYSWKLAGRRPHRSNRPYLRID